jgi:Asp-tRNA(Asn)/Glu-tRNA(Gln) amidotransferase A subunit family amidase
MLAGRPGEEHLLLTLAAQVESQGPNRPLRATLG